jgi:2'-5' RNA ligase
MAEARVDGGKAAQQARVFFALWPDAATAAQLHALGGELHRHCGGRRLRRETLHLTLAFLGDVPRVRVAELLALAAGVAGEAFSLKMERTGSWKGNRVVWAAPPATPPALERLADALSSTLRGAGFTLEERPFSPHLTLLRNARRPPPADVQVQICWPVASFALVESERLAEGAHYQVLGRWRLAALPNEETPNENAPDGRTP